MAENESQIKKRRLESPETNQGTSNNLTELTEKTLLENIHELIVKNQDEQKKFNEEVLENQRLTAEKIDKLSEEQQRKTIPISDESGDTKEKQKNEPAIENSAASSDTIVTPTAILPTTEKSFVLNYVFNNVSNMEEDIEGYSSEEAEHFGITWKINVFRENGWLAFFLFCREPINNKNWSVELNFVLKLIPKSGNHVTKEMNETLKNANGTWKYYGAGDDQFIKWKKLEKDYVNDDKFTTEIHVHISKMTGIYKDDLKIFDESMAKFSDVILIVKERKFYVLKLFLAANSPYFESLFLGQFQESKESEINLSGIDDDDFQKYLEVLYGEYAIDETTIEGILLVADMYDTPIVMRKCEEFLLEKSKKTLKKKLEMATKYNLEQLKKNCMAEIKTVTDI